MAGKLDNNEMENNEDSVNKLSNTAPPLSIAALMNNRALTERQQRWEEKKLLIAAMESEMIPVYNEADEDKPAPPPAPSPNPSTESADNQRDFEPCTFFLYGTLMDPEVLMLVAGLDSRPQLEDAWVEGFSMKMWNGVYPVLLSCAAGGSQGRIYGKVWQATTMNQCLRLQRYETSAYEPADCLIHVRSQGEPVKGLVFKWARGLESSELVEGSFDLEYWQKTHKTPLF